MRSLSTLQIGLEWFPENGGGLDRVYYELWRALPHENISFSGLVAGSPQVEVETAGAVRAFAAPNENLLTRLWKIQKAFPRPNSDLIVSHFALYTVPLIPKIRNQPLVIHFHGPWADEGSFEGAHPLRRSAKQWVESTVYRRATRAIVLSQAFATILTERYKVSPDRISIIPGGIDPTRFVTTVTRHEARQRLGWPQDRPILFSIRRLVPRMGLESLISAIKIIRDSVPDVLLYIAGKGILADRLSQQIQALGLSNAVKLLGFVPDDDLPLAYRAADLSIVPTIALEGFGLIAAESLAAGTPCLVTPIGGLPEVVAGLSPNLVMPSANIGDMAEAITQALTGRLALPDAAACRDYAVGHYSWSLIARQTADLYRQAVDAA